MTDFFNSNLKYMLKMYDMKAFCIANNLNYRTIQDLKKNINANPKKDTLIALSKALKVTIDELIFIDLSIVK